MHEATIKRLVRLQDQVKEERRSLHYQVFVESHPNLIEGDHQHNRKEIERYLRFLKRGFDSSKAIEEMVRLDNVIADLESMLWRYKNKS